MSQQFEDKISQVGDAALDLISRYFAGDTTPKEKNMVDKAFKFIGHPIKVMHMQQHRNLVERSQAIRLLQYFPTEQSKQEYIRLTQPQAAPLLTARPKKK
jgi:hypothetical protein